MMEWHWRDQQGRQQTNKYLPLESRRPTLMHCNSHGETRQSELRALWDSPQPAEEASNTSGERRHQPGPHDLPTPGSRHFAERSRGLASTYRHRSTFTQTAVPL